MPDLIQDILAPAARSVIDDVARQRTLLAFDFDGTLAPIVRDRAAAQLRPETRALLRAVALLYPCAIVSGRERSDVAARVAGIPLVAIVGNHGSEAGFGPLNRAVQRRVSEWAMVLSAALRGVPGAELENKRFSIAIHYRSAASWPEAERRVFSAVRALEARGCSAAAPSSTSYQRRPRRRGTRSARCAGAPAARSRCTSATT